MADLQRAVARMFAVGFPGTTVPPQMRDLIARGAGGAVLFKRNYASAQQLADLCAELKTLAGRPFLVCADQEGGRVIRFGPPFTPVPSMRAIGRTGDPALARRIGRLLARELRAANIDMDLAPVLDIDTNPANPVIGDRSFGRTPQLVSQLGVAFIEGMQSEGVAACGKHFPGHGDTSQDSHHNLPRLPHAMDRLELIELPPFAAAARAGVAAIMSAHVIFEAIDPTYPATMSRPVLNGLLREKLGFVDGVILSDDLGMKAVAAHFPLEHVLIRGANAGIDQFLMADDANDRNRAIDMLTKAVQRGDVPAETIDAANHRLDRLYERYVRPPVRGPVSAVFGCDEHQRLIAGVTSTEEAAHDPTVYQANQ
jgi:beta-N-acetylhexosaminidase